MKKIACTGYHATGAGVIDDLLREFDNVAQGTYEAETRLLQDPDGISDLEYYLVENPHRLNSGYALKRFLDYVNRTKRTYTKIFGKRWKEISYDYAESLAKFKYKGYWHGDVWLLSKFWQNVLLFRRGMAKILPKPLKKSSQYNYFPWLESYHIAISEDEFLEKTRNYIDRLCEELCQNGEEYVVLDQLVPPNHPARYARYVNDLKIIIVERDPRDLFLCLRALGDRVMPKDTEEFCEAYRDYRKVLSTLPPEQCMTVHFEDMIYHYDEYVKKVTDFIGLNETHHLYKKQHFDPGISIKNTKLWLKQTQYSHEIQLIEKLLPEYLYSFD